VLTIVDYGVGNLGSLTKMFGRLGIETERTADANRIAEATRLILPGVGAFDAAIRRLRDEGLEAPLRRAVIERRVPVLGVCLGMQLLGLVSEEGAEPGLGWLPARTVRLPDVTADGVSQRLPHMGWASVRPVVPNALLVAEGPPRFYFVHSYHLKCADASDELGRAAYGVMFTAAVHRENVWGVQFHPEKSHRYGQALLKRFAEL